MVTTKQPLQMKNQIVSVDWLHQNLHKNNIVILDASPIKTASKTVSPYSHLSIPSGRRFQIKEKFTNTESVYPNTVPSQEQFQIECRKLGINTDSEVIVFDNLGIYSSPRVWWLFKLMGHDNVKVLDGGLPQWINKGYETVEVEEVSQQYDIGNFIANQNSDYLLSYEDICDNRKSQQYQVVDARSSGRFHGTAEEPRKTLQSGNIPHSVNIPYQSVLDNGSYKSVEELRAIFAEATQSGADLVYSCGSGMTACIIMLAGELASIESRILFDGSWTEYAMREGLVVE